eukprot:g2881.t1
MSSFWKRSLSKLTPTWRGSQSKKSKSNKDISTKKEDETCELSSRMLQSIDVCLEKIRKEGTTAENIFAIPASTQSVKKLERKLLSFEKSGEDFNSLLFQIRQNDVFVVADTVKKILRTRIPLIPIKLFDAFNRSVEYDGQKRSHLLPVSKRRLSGLVEKIPPEPRKTLVLLLRVCVTISNFEMTTKMSLASVARLWGPTVLRSLDANANKQAILYRSDQGYRVMKALLDLVSDEEEVIIRVDPSTRSLGVEFEEAAEYQDDGGVRVIDFVRKGDRPGPIENSGRVRVGMILTDIDGEDVSRSTFDYVFAKLTKETDQMRRLTFRSDSLYDHKVKHPSLYYKKEDSPAVEDGGVVNLTIDKTFDGPLGVELEEAYEDKNTGVRIVAFVQDDRGNPGQIEASGRVRVGMLLTNINGVDVSEETFESVLKMLRASAGKDRRLSFRSDGWVEEGESRDVDDADDENLSEGRNETGASSSKVRKIETRRPPRAFESSSGEEDTEEIETPSSTSVTGETDRFGRGPPVFESKDDNGVDEEEKEK